MTETARIDTTISAPVALASAAVFFGTLFQIGYFGEIGIEFLSMTGAGDWLYAIGFVGGPALTLWWPLEALYKWIDRGIENGDLGESWFFKAFQSKEARFVGMTVFCLGLYLLIIERDAAGLSLTNLARLFFGFGFLIGALYFLNVLIRGGFEDVDVSNLLWFAALSGIFFWFLGHIYAAHFAGRYCTLIAADNRFDQGMYYRSVGEGHLFRTGGRMHFIPKGNVKELICR